MAASLPDLLDSTASLAVEFMVLEKFNLSSEAVQEFMNTMAAMNLTQVTEGPMYSGGLMLSMVFLSGQ